MEKPFHQEAFPFVLKSCHFWRRFKVKMSCGIAAKLSCNDTLAVEWLWNGRRPQMALPTVSKCVWKLDRIAAPQSVYERANVTHRVKSRKHQAHIFQANDRHINFPNFGCDYVPFHADVALRKCNQTATAKWDRFRCLNNNNWVDPSCVSKELLARTLWLIS